MKRVRFVAVVFLLTVLVLPVSRAEAVSYSYALLIADRTDYGTFGLDQEYRMILAVSIDTPDTTVSCLSPDMYLELDRWPGWDVDVNNYSFQKVVSCTSLEDLQSWDSATYTFSADSESRSVEIPRGSIQELEVPEVTVANGTGHPSVSWTGVNSANFYRVRLFPLDGKGNPDTSNLLFDSENLHDTTYSFTGEEFDFTLGRPLAIRVEAWQTVLAWQLYNRSISYARHTNTSITVGADQRLELLVNITNAQGVSFDDITQEWFVLTGTLGGEMLPIYFLTSGGEIVDLDSVTDLSEVTYAFDHTSATATIATLTMEQLGLGSGDSLMYCYAYRTAGASPVELENIVTITVE
jgi:hypothetical protein